MDNPRLFPLNAKDVSRLPEAVIFTFEFDPFRDEGAAYAEKVRKAGVRVTYRCFPGLVHVGAGLPADAAENKEIYEIKKAAMKQARLQ